MAKIVYRIMFSNGNTVTFDSDMDVDFHKIGVNAFGAGTLAFDDAFINLQHVIFIDKEVKNDGQSNSKN